jgi:hypothetical protein
MGDDIFLCDFLAFGEFAEVRGGLTVAEPSP